MAASAYPPPPAYYRLYSDDGPPPPPPIEGSYTLFGAEYTTEDALPGLEEQGVRQLYPKEENIDVKKELRALGREVVLEVLELTDTLVQRPSQFARRVEDLGLLFKNVHHLLNSLRPHQARATLIHILEMQLEQRKKAIADIRQRREEAKQLREAAVSDIKAALQKIESQDSVVPVKREAYLGQENLTQEPHVQGDESLPMQH